MGDCRYCGEPAGLLRSSHKDCEEKSRGGSQQISGLIGSFVETNESTETLKSEVRAIAQASLLPDAEYRDAIQHGFVSAVDRCLSDHLITLQEESAILLLAAAVGVDLDDPDFAVLKSRLVKGAVLREAHEGSLTDRVSVTGHPFLIPRDEKIVWFFNTCQYYEMRRHSEYVAGSHGMSFRIAKGVYYRVGASRGERISTDSFEQVDAGSFGITDRHILFSGSSKKFKIKLSKLISCELMSDGILFHKDGANPKPQGIKLDDPWFAANLISALQ